MKHGTAWHIIDIVIFIKFMNGWVRPVLEFVGYSWFLFLFWCWYIFLVTVLFYDFRTPLHVLLLSIVLENGLSSFSPPLYLHLFLLQMIFCCCSFSILHSGICLTNGLFGTFLYMVVVVPVVAKYIGHLAASHFCITFLRTCCDGTWYT